MKYRTTKQILLASVLLPLWGMAQEVKQENIQEVIVHANRLQIPFSKDNRNVEVLTAKDIQKLPAKSLNEVLTFLNGVDIRQRGPFGTQADMSIDGGSFEQTLLLVNGVKVSDPQTAHHSLNLPIPLEAIERIEVLRGPAARIYGITALTGAINIITKSVEHTSITAHIYAGSGFKGREEEDKSGIYQHSGALIGATWQQEGHQHQIYYNREKSNGQRYNSASENDKLFYQGNLDMNAHNKMEWLASYLYNAFGANGFYAAPDDKESEEIVKTFFTSIASKHQITDKLYISPRISNRANDDDYRYFKHDLSRARSKHYNNALSAELNTRYQTSFGDFGFGWESRFEDIRSTNLGNHERKNHGAYGEFRTENIRNLTLNVGAYLNYNSQYGWQLYPGVDMGYSFTPQWKVVFNAGSSQRIPSFTDLYLNQRPGNIGNPDLRSENAWQIEGAVKFQSEKLTGHAGYFRRTISDFIDWVRQASDEPYQPFNLGKNVVNGINSNLNYRIEANRTTFNLNAGYNFLDPSIKTNDAVDSKYTLENLKHQAKLLLTAQQHGWGLSLANRFNQRISNTSYFLTDIRLSCTLTNFTVYADAQNLFDVTYIESAAIPMPGRWFSTGLKYQWVKR